MTARENNTERELFLSRMLSAPLDLVWEVCSQPEHIAQWWGPDGFTTTIHEMSLSEGGEWNLTMHGPDGTDYKNKSVFREIVPMQKIIYEHVSAPHFIATLRFEAKGEETLLEWHMLFDSKEQLEQVVKVFKADVGLQQNAVKLRYYLEAQQRIRKELGKGVGARVSTYLNFPGNTEAAFLFYRSVFGGEFNGGIQRFGDLPAAEGMPVLPEPDKKLILHIELPIMGGHVLMATDAPESMGFTVTKGNNIHINLEPATREETKRLFDALSEGGNVSMPLQDMFWGAYYGSCTDRYGINWMLNCVAK